MKMLTTLLLLGTFSSALCGLLPTEMAFGEIILQVTATYTNIWDDTRSGANLDGSFWTPRPDGLLGTGLLDDARPTGHAVVSSHNAPSYATLLLRPSSTASTLSPPLASPVSYRKIWSDEGSGATRSVSVWAPQCPTGYNALGSVATAGYNVVPNLNTVYCVRSDLTRRGITGGLGWEDRGSGANQDGAFYFINAPGTLGSVSDTNRSLLTTGSFFGVNTYDTPSTFGTTETYVLNVPYPQSATNYNQPPPMLTSRDPPADETGPLLSRTIMTPLTAVTDNAHTLQWKVQNSPFYTLQRVSNYKLQVFVNNQASVAQTITKSVEFGTSKSQETSYSIETGVSVSVEAGISFIAQATATSTFSLSLGYSSSTNVGAFETTTTTYPLTVPPKNAGALWSQQDSIQVIRGDNTMVSTLRFNPSSVSVVTDTYPSKK